MKQIKNDEKNNENKCITFDIQYFFTLYNIIIQSRKYFISLNLFMHVLHVLVHTLQHIEIMIWRPFLSTSF